MDALKYLKTIKDEINNIFHPIDFPKPSIISVNNVELEVFETGAIKCRKSYCSLSRFSRARLFLALPDTRFGEGRIPCNSSQSTGIWQFILSGEVTEYDIEHLTGDLVGLLDYYGYDNAIFIGHDWGANVVWKLAQLHPERVNKVINLALPYQERGEKPWIEFMEEIFGEDFYFVHFNRQPGVADAILNANTSQFISNIFRKHLPLVPPEPGMLMINLARAKNHSATP